MRDPEQPLSWVGADRLLLNDVTPAGLHRKVIARKGEAPNVDDWLRATRIESRAAEIQA